MKGYSYEGKQSSDNKGNRRGKHAEKGCQQGFKSSDSGAKGFGRGGTSFDPIAEGLGKGAKPGRGQSLSDATVDDLCLEALSAFAIRDADGFVCPLIDIGVNLGKFSPQEIERQLRRAAAAGVRELICTGTSVRCSTDTRRICNSAPCFEGAPRLFFTAGVHPHQAKTCGPGTIDALRKLAADEACVAIGECGLDYDRMFSPREVQLVWFRAQLDLAKELGLPLFCHERDRDLQKGVPLGSANDFLRVLRESEVDPAMVCVHCYTGDKTTLRQYASAGCAIGVTGFVGLQRRSSHLRALLARGMPPLSQLMIETDAPFMMPDRCYLPRDIGMQDRTMEPCAMPAVCRAVAECYGVEPSEVANITTRNAHTFFRLSGLGSEPDVDTRPTGPSDLQKTIMKYEKKLREIEALEASQEQGKFLEPNQQKKVDGKVDVQKLLADARCRMPDDS